jgi:hypothetical protein
LNFAEKSINGKRYAPTRILFMKIFLLADIRKNHDPGTIELKSWHKIGNVEKEFYLMKLRFIGIFNDKAGGWNRE